MHTQATPSRSLIFSKVSDIKEGTKGTGPKPRGWQIRFNESFTSGRLSSCWEWSGQLTNNGYGIMSICNCPVLAHRLAFLLANERIDPDLVVMHSCDNRICVNPAHLSQGTDADNIHDAWLKGRLQKGETNGMAKLKEKDVLYIRKQRSRGVLLRILAEKFKVWPACISNIANRKMWKHV